MAFITSEKYNEVIYSQDDKNEVKISFNGVELDDAGTYCEKITRKARVLPDDGTKRFSLDNFVSTELEVILHNVDINKIQDQVEISIGTLVDEEKNTYEYVPIGIFNIQDTPTTDNNKTTIKLRDNRVKFDFYYNAQPLIEANNGKATKKQILNDICSQAGVTNGVESFDGEDDEVGIYDNTIQATTYVSYLAEQGGNTAVIDRYGKLIFIDYTNLVIHKIPLKLLEKYEIGTPYQVQRVVYESGIIKYQTSSDETLDTLYINSANPYITSQEQIDKIYEKLKNFKIDSLTTGKVLGNPAIDPYDLIQIYGYYEKDDNGNDIFVNDESVIVATTLANTSYTFTGVHRDTFTTEIGVEQRTENVSVNSEATFQKYAKTNIDNLNATITLQAGEISDLSEKTNTLEMTSTSTISRITNVEKDVSDTKSSLDETNKNISALQSDVQGVSADFTDFKDNEYINSISNLQNQIDGAIQFWNGAEIPTIDNYPANEWTTENDKINHQADIYTVIQDVDGEMKQGKSYRFDKVNDTWQWIELTDNELSAVQAIAQKALDKSEENEKEVKVLKETTTELQQTDTEIKASVDTLDNNYKEIIETTKEVTGENNLYIEDALSGNALEYHIDGKCEQDGTPTPDNPIEIETVKGITNLFNINGNEKKYNNAAETINDNVFKIKSTGTYARIWYKLDEPLKIGETVTISFNYQNSITSSIEFSFNTDYNVYTNRINIETGQKDISETTITKTFTITNEIKYFAICVNNTSSDNGNETIITDLQIEKSSIAHPYVPYGSWLRVSTNKENLFDKNSVNKLNAYINGSSGAIQSISTAKCLYIPINPDTTYSITKLGTRFRLITTSSVPAVGTTSYGIFKSLDGSTETTITTTSTDNYLCINYWINTDTLTEQEILDSLIVYDKSQEQITYIDMNKYDDEDNITDYYELCSIEDTKDTLDIEDGQVSIDEKIGKIVLDGSEIWATSGASVNTGVKAYVLSGIGNTYNIANDTKGYSDRFILISNSSEWNTTEYKNSGYCRFTSNNLYIRISESLAPDVATLKTWLSENPVTIYYVLSESKQIALPSTNIPLYEDINNVSLQSTLDTNTNLKYLVNNVLNGTYASKSELIVAENQIKSDISATYTTKDETTELSNTIDQKIDDKENSIMLEVGKKVNNTDYNKASIVAKINDSTSEVKIDADNININATNIINILAGNEINLSTNSITLKSEYLNINNDGTMTILSNYYNRYIDTLDDIEEYARIKIKTEDDNLKNYLFPNAMIITTINNEVLGESYGYYGAGELRLADRENPSDANYIAFLNHSGLTLSSNSPTQNIIWINPHYIKIQDTANSQSIKMSSDNILVNSKSILPEVLYEDEDGTTGNITFNIDKSNYSYIEIFYKTNNDNCDSKKIMIRSGRQNVSLYSIWQVSDLATGYAQIDVRAYYLDEKELKPVYDNSTYFNLEGKAITYSGLNKNENDAIKIFKVLAYEY